MVEVLIEEMAGSHRSRPQDYERAVVVEPRATNKTTLWSERSSVLKKRKKGDKKRSKQKKNDLDPADIVRDGREADYASN